MKKLLCVVFTLSWIILSQSKNQANPSYPIDAGSIIKNRYSNYFFKMSLSIPDKWYLLSDKEKKGLIIKQKQLVSANKMLKKSYEKSIQNTSYLLVLFRYPPDLPTTYNPSFICVAENIKNKPQIRTGKDYLQFIKRIYQNTKTKNKIDIAHEEMTMIGDKLFDTLSLKVPLGKYSVSQKFYVTLVKDYALSFIVTYTNEEEKKIQESIIKSIQFD